MYLFMFNITLANGHIYPIMAENLATALESANILEETFQCGMLKTNYKKLFPDEIVLTNAASIDHWDTTFEPSLYTSIIFN